MESTSECPICRNVFESSKIEAHVNACLEGGGQEIPVEIPMVVEDENERLFREFLAQEEAAAKAAMASREAETELKCKSCSVVGFERMFFFDICSHYACRKCIVANIMKNVAEKKCTEIKCHECAAALSPGDIKILLTHEQYDQYINNSFGEFVSKNETFVQCPHVGCSAIIEVRKNDQQDPSLPEAERHKNNFRFRCRQCDNEFCASCHRIPYHNGFTCEKFVLYQKAKQCRFCRDQLVEKNMAVLSSAEKKYPGLAESCNKRDCSEKRLQSCEVTHKQCGHHCGGVRGEKKHLPCLHKDCTKPDQDNASSDCIICYVEGIGYAPSIQLGCGHIFHHECIKQTVASKWTSSNITFGFMQCPVCKQQVSHPSLDGVLKPMVELYNQVKERALQRLKYMNEENAKEIVNKDGPYFKNPVGYALRRYCYYLCFKCKKPYFGGERACNAEQRVEGNHDPAELICGSCSGVPAAGTNPNCKHGTEFIEWKCRFCCQVACWFCWGTTHFCDDCHKQATAMSKKEKHLLPKCTCKIPHPPNGDEFCLGCSMCRLQPVDF